MQTILPERYDIPTAVDEQRTLLPPSARYGVLRQRIEPAHGRAEISKSASLHSTHSMPRPPFAAIGRQILARACGSARH
jgi:hypothetical protein